MIHKTVENLVDPNRIKPNIAHGTKAQTDKHTPEPLSGAVANIRVFHDVFFTSNGKGDHHFKDAARPNIKAVGNYSITIALLATEPISKLDAILGPVAVHRDCVCKLRVVELVEQSPVGLIRISVVDHEPVHPLEIWIIKLAFGQGQTSSSLSGSRANRVKLASTKKGIENFLTGSLIEIRPMSINKLQGLRCKIATVDEWLSGDIREDVIGAIEQGASKVDDYLIVATSSEGTVRNGAGDTIKMELMSILKGDYPNPHVSIWWYKLDSVDEVGYPEMWMKANPNIGKTVSYETYQLDVERAEKAPAARNDILAKRFGLPMEGYTYYFTYEETLPHRKRDYWQMACALGGDLSQGDDFCSFTFLFPLRNGSFGVKTRNYITSRTLNKLPAAMRNKYEQFMDEGSLVVLDGTVLDPMQVYEDLDEYIVACGYDVRCFGYDPYNAKEFVERWAAENGPFGIDKVIQGAKTESVPLGELKKLAEDRMLLFDEELMTYAMGNCIAMEDTNGNRKLMKKRYEQKIDAVSAMMDAYIAYKRNPEAFE